MSNWTWNLNHFYYLLLWYFVFSSNSVNY
jgi:hypothetical protein